MKLVYFLVLLFFVSPTSADITWNQQCLITVYTNTNVTCGNLQISNIQFSSPVKGVKDLNKNIVPEYTVIPSIIFDTNFEKQILLATTDSSYIEQKNKSIRIDVSGFPDGNSNVWIIENYNPSATLTIYTRQIPQVQLSLISDQSVYEDGKDKNINITLSIKNTDVEQFKPMRIIFNQGNLTNSKTFPTAQRDFVYCCISPNQILSYTYNLEVPDVIQNTSYSVNTIIELQDPVVISRIIDYNVSTSFIIIPQKQEGHVMVTKFIQDRLYTSDNVSITITIINQGAYSLYGVIVNDTLPSSLYPLNSSQMLNWYIPEIKSNDQVEISYKVYPTAFGALNLPLVVIHYSYLGQNYQASSNQVSANIINNPYMKLRTAPSPIPTPTLNPIISKSNISNKTITSPTPIPTIFQTPSPTQPTPNVTIPGLVGIEGIIVIVVVITIQMRKT